MFEEYKILKICLVEAYVYIYMDLHVSCVFSCSEKPECFLSPGTEVISSCKPFFVESGN